MKSRITRKMLADWAGPRVMRDAEVLLDRGYVLEAELEPPYLRGSVLASNHPLKTGIKLMPDGNVESLCPCRDNQEKGIICAHVIAVGLVVVARSTDALRERKYQVEMRKSRRVASVDDELYIRRMDPGSKGSIPAKLRIAVLGEWLSSPSLDTVPVVCRAEYKGEKKLLDEVSPELPLAFSKQDAALLFVLEDICGGPARGHMELCAADFGNVLELLGGRKLLREDGGTSIVVNKSNVPTHLKMDMSPESGELLLSLHTELPFMTEEQSCFYVVSDRTGWVCGADNFWPLGNVLSRPYHSLYQQDVAVARPDVLRFLREELPALSECARVESDISEDLFTVEPEMPRLRLLVKGSAASLAATLYATYGDVELIAGKADPNEHFALPDEEDLMRYTGRNMEEERQALEVLSWSGFRGEYGDELERIVGIREVLNFMGGQMPALRRRGWRVDLEGRIGPHMETLDFATPVVHIADSEGSGWFDVGFDFEDAAGKSLSPAEIQRAIRKGESYVERGGKTILLDSDAISSMQDVFSDCGSSEADSPGHFRVDGVYAPFVEASLGALDGIDVEVAASWRERATCQNRQMKIERIALGSSLEKTLRSYQRDGVDWLRFLEANGFCGILADEMGLGKTLQTLAWLDLARERKESQGKPALIVCPTSIVENWVEEAARFVPGMKTLSLSGSDRHDKFDQLSDVDMAVTSYALLRRDIDRYLEHELSVVVLDEAQHIKNRSTQNAVVAKTLRAHHKLVLTGTPIENSVSDLWSIMDFLMPKYLGVHEAFRQDYANPIARGGPLSELAQIKLRRKMHPFLLRRLKTQVAADLPPKIEKVSFCTMTADQQMVYKELLDSSRRKISSMVSKKGFDKCRMEILTTLMRLRQVCCHLDLLKMDTVESKYPSGKMDLFFELLDEAMDGGHRALVFSQFVSMLHIIRDEFKKRGVEYCYLDGATKNRGEVVRKFNVERDIPVFLISLRAGGTGLNLTGADLVIHYDPWWNPAVEDQATDRAHRIGQKRTVYGLKLITKGTVEEKVLELQRKKRQIIEGTLGSDERIMQSMSWDDIQYLLTL